MSTTLPPELEQAEEARKVEAFIQDITAQICETFEEIDIHLHPVIIKRVSDKLHQKLVQEAAEADKRACELQRTLKAFE